MSEKKTLTVSELIELLKPFSGDTPVNVYCEGKYVMEGVTGIAEVKNDGVYLDTTGN